MNHVNAITQSAYRIRVRGAVQGVGFRPTVYRLARNMAAKGWVRNDSDGVLIHLDSGDANMLLDRLQSEQPILARIDGVDVTMVCRENHADFQIVTSDTGPKARTRISADAATCGACLEDVFDPTNRRAGYAFTNCTHCGPRYSITHKVPYDRTNTSMAAFAMCSSCGAEYADPLDRRFHAQPNACPECGPQLSHPIEHISEILMQGGVIALKGLGGYQLLADATNEAAAARLRLIKQRDAKPFAVMVAGIASAKRFANLDPSEQALLEDHRRPIVVLEQAQQAAENDGLAASVTLGLGTIGLMLPTTALHYLLFHQAIARQIASQQIASLSAIPPGTAWIEEADSPAFICTSANIAGEPILTDDDAARAAFDDKVDLVVTHNRPIVIPVDDSVTRVIDGQPRLLRRARGYAPDPIKLVRSVTKDGDKPGFPSILALGAELKNTVALTRDDDAFLSQHIGAQTGIENQALQQSMTNHLCAALDVTPALIVTDLHPDMNSGAIARFTGTSTGTPMLRVQHHHAHIASVLAEHQINTPTLGIALDGYGLGADGVSSWGGELLWVDGADMVRVGGLRPLQAPGGDAASRDPWRMAISLCLAAGCPTPDHLSAFDGAMLVRAMCEKKLNAPETSSAGRLFDGVAALLGVHSVNRFEGEAAMRLEDLARAPFVDRRGWEIDADGHLSLLPLVATLCGASAQEGANLFHGTMAAGLVDWATRHAEKCDYQGPIALSGGCFQNKILTELVTKGLRQKDFTPLLNSQVPANDGGLALGQAWVAAHHLQRRIGGE